MFEDKELELVRDILTRNDFPNIAAGLTRREELPFGRNLSELIPESIRNTGLLNQLAVLAAVAMERNRDQKITHRQWRFVRAAALAHLDSAQP